MSFRTAYGYAHSENGWRMCNRDECAIANVPLTYIDTAPIRRGDPTTILGAWMVWYDRNVEEIGSPVWGWSNTNDVGNSNHLSGTALDINAPKYPWGLRTMPQARINKIRQGLSLFEGSVFWGADWGRADEMHYQIGWPEGDRRVAAFAQKLRNGHLGIYGTPTLMEAVMSLSDEELSKRFPSRSKYRTDNKPVDTLAGMVLNIDAMTHEAAVERHALNGVQWAIDLVKREAGKGDEAAKAVLKKLEGK